MVRVTGAARHLRRLQAARGAAQTLDRGVYLAAETIRAEAQYLIVQGSISGAGHVPSVQGQPPNADTRQLDQSINAVKVGPYKANVEVDAPYGVHLEFGTSKMGERRFLRPAVKRTAKRILDNLGLRVRMEVRRG